MTEFFLPRSTGVTFDINADGRPDRIAWTVMNSDDSFLFIDRDGDHAVSDGSELVGFHSAIGSRRWTDGFAAQAAYDQARLGGNEDGFITADDAVWSLLYLWTDSDHNGVTSRREVRPLNSSAAIRLYLVYAATGHDVSGNLHLLGTYWVRERGGGILKRSMDDVFFDVVLGR